MFDAKSIFASRTIWANMIGLAAFGLSIAGVETGSIDQAGLADALIKLIAAGGFIASTFFRVLAVHKLH